MTLFVSLHYKPKVIIEYQAWALSALHRFYKSRKAIRPNFQNYQTSLRSSKHQERHRTHLKLIVGEKGKKRFGYIINLARQTEIKQQRKLPIRPILMPERARALSADWAPGPGVLVLFPPVARSFICKAVMPSSYKINTKSQEAVFCIISNYHQQAG